MKPIPMIRASAAVAVAELLGEAGAPVARVWSQSDLPLSARVEPERLVPLHLALRFGEEAANALDAPDLGLRVAKRSGLTLAGRFGRSIQHAPTLYGAVSVMCSMVPLHNSGARYWLAPDGDSVRLCRRFRSTDGAFRQSDLLTVALLTDVLRAAAGPGWLPSRVELQSTDPKSMCSPSLLESLATGTVEDGRLTTSITFPRALLARRLPAAVPAAPAVGDSWLEHAPPTEFLASVDMVIEATLESDHPDVTVAARAAGLSVRSFQRRLAEAGVSYSDLVDRVRYRKAIDWLQDADIKIIDVAFALGYSDPAHFTRAFRRWTSLTPLEYRHLHQLGPTRETA